MHTPRLILTVAFALGSAFGQVRGGSNYEEFLPNQADFKSFNTFSLCLSTTRHFESKSGPVINSIFHYDVARDSIDAELQAMFDQGQRRLRIPIGFLSSGDQYSCQYVTTPGGVMPDRFRNNLIQLLATIRRIGYEEIIVGFFPFGSNFPVEWTQWQEGLYQDNWNLIKSLRPLISAAGIPYLIDLGNELIAAPTQQVGQKQALAYTQRQWKDYTDAFGKEDTLGFSLIANVNQFRADSLPAVYGDNPPSVFDLHIYEDAANTFVYEKKRLDQLGYANVDWIIGETYADGASTAAQLREAIQSTGKPVRYVLQWPEVPDGTLTSNRDPNLAWLIPAIVFGSYMTFGF